MASSQVPATKTQRSDGPAFEFPDSLAPSADIVIIEDERLLERNFRGWVPGEIAAGRFPVMAIVDNGEPVSICFCARRSDLAAEAGLDTAEAYRGRGLGPRVTAAWALAIRTSGRIPLYSTSWTNHASLAVARKLNLVAYASAWGLSDFAGNTVSPPRRTARGNVVLTAGSVVLQARHHVHQGDVDPVRPDRGPAVFKTGSSVGLRSWSRAAALLPAPKGRR
jgi:GNAT acetyltransferase-like protein